MIEPPDGYSCVVSLTHDIDLINQTWKSKAILVKQKRFNEIIWKKEPYRNLDVFMDLEESCGGKGTYFVMALRKSEPHFNYDTYQYQNDFREIIARGHEVGLHGGLSAYNSPTKLIQEKTTLEAVLGRPVNGYRSHYMQLDIPETWQILTNMGFLYDATFFNMKHHSQRWKGWYPPDPFAPFRPTKNKEQIDLWVMPLTHADFVFYDYCKLSNEKTCRYVVKKINEAKKEKGYVSLLWHNSTVGGGKDEVFKKIVQCSVECNAWMPTLSELREHLQQNMGDTHAAISS